MADPIEDYTHRLASHLSGRIPEETLRNYLDDAQRHLQDSADELAQKPRVLAESEAIRRFGDAESIAREILWPEPKPFWKAAWLPLVIAFVIPFLPLLGTYIVFTQPHPTPSNGEFLLWQLPLLGAGVFVAATYSARRVLLGGLASTVALSLVAVSLFHCYLFVVHDPERGMGIWPRAKAQQLVDSNPRIEAVLAQYKNVADHATSFYSSAEDKYRREFETSRGYAVPTGAEEVGSPSRLRNLRIGYTYVKDLGEARAEWRSRNIPYDVQTRMQIQQEWALRQEDIDRPPLAAFVGITRAMAPFAALYLLVLLGLNLLGVAASKVVNRWVWPRRRYAT